MFAPQPAVVLLLLLAVAPWLARGVPADVVAPAGTGRGGAPAPTDVIGRPARHRDVHVPRHRAGTHELAA